MTITAVAGTGALGTGFLEETLQRAVESGADFIGCDGGSSDGGPYYLGSGQPKVSEEAYKRDLRFMLRAAVERSIPLVMGSSGYAGGTPHLAWAADLVREVAAEEGLHFDMALIDSELDKSVVYEALKAGRIQPLGPAGDLDPERIDNAERIVAQIGSEPFEAALRGGAQVVVAGRATDTAIFACVPRLAGLTGGPTWHAAKVLECGAACVEQRAHPDSMVARIEADRFTLTPPNPNMRCTPQSVAAHTLYENGDPFRLIEPGGILDTTGSRYAAEPDGISVTVSERVMLPKDRYDVRLEAAQAVGYRSIAIGGIRDPLVVGDIDEFVTGATRSIIGKVRQSMQLEVDRDYVLHVHVYGRDGCLADLEPVRSMAGHEVGIVIEIVADTQKRARGICTTAWHTMLHHPIPQWSGFISNLAFPFSPPNIDLGLVYEFSMNHVMALDDPLDVGRISYERV